MQYKLCYGKLGNIRQLKIIFTHGNLEKLMKSHGNWLKKSGIPACTITEKN